MFNMSGLGQVNCICGLGLVTTVTVFQSAGGTTGRQRAPMELVTLTVPAR